MMTARQNVVAGRDPLMTLPLRSLAKKAPLRAVTCGVAERMLLDAAERAQRRGAAVEALLVRLSRIPPPGAKPHHRRIARSLLDEAALRRGAQVFALRNLDLVLFGPDARASELLLARLFGEDGVVQVLAPGAALLAYVHERASEDLPVPALPTEAAPLPALDMAESLLESALPGDLLHVQVAAELLPRGALRPLFREASPRLHALAAQLPGGDAQAPDPLAFRALAGRLDARTLAVACADLAQGGPLSGGASPALHLNLTLGAVLSPGFTRFAAAVRSRGRQAGVEVLLAEVCGDPTGFEQAKVLVRDARFTLALDGVGYQALRIAYPGRLGADLVKLDWSDDLAAAGADAEAAIHEIGPERVVLTQADNEAAVRWGYLRGVRRFQGRHVDAMLAAVRLGACAFAAGCSLRLCAERASAAGVAGRSGCQNTPLLDAAA